MQQVNQDSHDEIVLGPTVYLYDGNNVLEEVDASGAVAARYTFSQRIDQPLAEFRSGTTTFYQADGLGSVTSLSNSAGTLASTYSYDSFGKMFASSGTVNNPFQYTGREFDAETSIYEYRMRYYDPNVGRFLSEDPIGFSGGNNFYRYVRNSPSRFVDPSGMVIVPNGTPQQNQDYGSAINYLGRDPQMASVINDLQNSSTIYLIDFNNNDDDSFDPSTNTINWDPHSGCSCTSGGIQSPALGLGHEMGHAHNPHLGGFLSSISIFAGNYDNWEEGRVITGLESATAETLGEPKRPDHRCAATPWVPNPTSHTPVVYPPRFSLSPYGAYVLSAGPH
jgi:RHS repeat-associated protein